MAHSIKNSYWLRSGFFTILERLGVQVFGFGAVFFLFRALSIADFESWVLYLAIINILEVGRAGLIQNALIKFLSADEQQAAGANQARINTASLTLNGIITAGIVVVLLLLSEPAGWLFGSAELPTMLRIYCLTTVLLTPFFQSNFTQQAHLQFSGITWSNMMKQGSLFAFIAVLYLSAAEVTLLRLVWWQVIGAVLASGVSVYFGKRFLTFNRQIDLPTVRELFHYGKFVFGTNLSTMLYKSIDKMMLGALPAAGAGAVAIYEAAIKVTNLVEVPTFSMASMLFPQSARSATDKGALKQLYEKAVGSILAILVPGIILVELFAEPIITFIASEKYLAAAPLLRWTILYGLFIPFAIQFGTVLDSMGKPKVNFRITLLSMVLNVVFNFIFINAFGIAGAAYGTLLTYGVTFVIMQRLLYRELDIRFYEAFRHIPQFYQKALQLIGARFTKNNKNTPIQTPEPPTVHSPKTPKKPTELESMPPI